MWLATKEAAKGGRKHSPKGQMSLTDLASQLGGSLPDAISYRRLVEEHPEVELGPDQDRLDHFNRLKRQREFWRSTDTTDADRRAADPRARVMDEPAAKTPAWARELVEQKSQAPANPAAPTPGFHSGLPHRIPGWFTGDAQYNPPPPDHGTPRMPRRDPGSTMRAPVSPVTRPQLPTRDEWVKGLADKGIFLDHNGQRMTPQQMTLPLRPGVKRNIWHDLVEPLGVPDYRGRHRASKVVVAYVNAVLLSADGAELGNISWEEGW